MINWYFDKDAHDWFIAGKRIGHESKKEVFERENATFEFFCIKLQNWRKMLFTSSYNSRKSAFRIIFYDYFRFG